MYVEPWAPMQEQMAKVGRHSWSVVRLIALSKDLPVMDVPLDALNVWHKYDGLRLRDMVMHMKAVLAADLSCPIILDEDGEVMDGRHRLMKAILDEVETVKVVRFQRNPPPDRTDD